MIECSFESALERLDNWVKSDLKHGAELEYLDLIGSHETPDLILHGVRIASLGRQSIVASTCVPSGAKYGLAVPPGTRVDQVIHALLDKAEKLEAKVRRKTRASRKAKSKVRGRK